ncbi:MAG: hypothetical protein K8L99_14910 [Anaerolineae bacterium]|nr:hypothetical protein [Anaerolineae bacterium]
MTDQVTYTNTKQGDKPKTQDHFKIVAAIALLFSFGLTMFLFSAAYAKDIDTLRRAPELVWAFICGQPNPDGITLPLLLTISFMAVLVGGGLSLWTWWKTRH